MSSVSRRRFVAGVAGAATAVTVGTQLAQAAPGAGRAATLAADDPYVQLFLTQYNKIKAPANGYFSPQGVPYHSVETLLVEAPDHGHQTTSEAFSYWLWLEAVYGRVTGDWKPFNDAWAATEKYIIPTRADQPTNDSYNPAKPATYAPEWPEVNKYPSALDPAVAVGQDPIANELKNTYGTSDIYGMHWLLDVDNVYGYGCTPGTGGQNGPTAPGPSYINTYQRGSEESVWETVPQPSIDLFKHGGPNGYLDLFVKDSSYARQWKYTNAPDADARAVQAAYWAYRWAQAQGKQADISATVAKAAKMGDYLRYALFDKYFKRAGDCTDPQSCPAGSGRSSAHYLLSWYYAWGGAAGGSGGGWAWRIGGSASHQGYQNVMAAWALSTVPALTPKSPTAQSDWATSLNRQLEFTRWLQSAEGGIAGGATNSWDGQYGKPPAGTPTFYGMAYDWQPVYHDPPSNNWFGMQAWGVERVAEYYYLTGNATAKAVLDKWVPWAAKHTTAGPNGEFRVPSTLNWTGQPDTWNASSPGGNANLHVTVTEYGQDVGVGSALAKTFLYYAAKAENTEIATLAKNLLDAMATHADAKGISVPETRADYRRFNDPVYIPSGWTGTMPNGDRVASGSTFSSIRTFYRRDPAWPQVQSYLSGGSAPTFTYHRFWAQAGLAIAFGVYAELFGEDGGGGDDTEAPTAPGGLRVTATTANSVSLSWTASTDNVGVAGYLVFRDGAQVGTATGLTFTDSGLTAETRYAYTVRARDAAGNTSADSASVTATTSTGGGTGSLTAAYRVDNDWGSGFTATVTVTNNGTRAVSAWTVTWAWAGNQRVANAWNATVTQSGTAVTARNAGHNGTIAPGSSVSFGFQGTYSGTNAAPRPTVTGS
ncbi:hypothetical protein GCM10027168_48910 [Streptomyces capparidis]